MSKAGYPKVLPSGEIQFQVRKGFVRLIDMNHTPPKAKAFRVTLKSGVEPIVRYFQRSQAPGKVFLSAASPEMTDFYTELVKTGLQNKTSV